MCGRTACNLAPDILCRACTYKGDDENGTKWRKPRWRDHPSSKQDGGSSYTYYPSANMAPTRFTPVLKQEEEDNGAKGEGDVGREIMPMMFGMIPSFHKGPPKTHGLSTNNCRLEGLVDGSNKLYKKAWSKRQFCVVVCQGFYEWKTGGGVGEAKGVKRQPYFIYKEQSKDGVSVVKGENYEGDDKWSEENGWEGPELLNMAGLWDVWKDGAGEEVYSYTIITMESNDKLNWLHHRMPAILDGEEDVAKWLEAGKRGLGDKECLELLKQTKLLKWHKVNGKVGNSRCQDKDCMEEVSAGEKVGGGSTFLDKWVIKKTTAPVKVKQEDEEDEGQKDKDDGPSVKRVKRENE